MRMSTACLPLIAATMLLAACGDKQPATSAVDQAEKALANLRDDASQFAPAELEAADATLANMKGNLAKQDYRAVISDVPQFNANVRTVKETVVSSQTLAVADQREWEALTTEVPLTIESIQSRVEQLAAGRLPEGVSKEDFATAKVDLETLKATWQDATTAASAGDTTEAASMGRNVQAKAEELKNELGMNQTLASNTTTVQR